MCLLQNCILIKIIFTKFILLLCFVVFFFCFIKKFKKLIQNSFFFCHINFNEQKFAVKTEQKIAAV